MQSRSYMSLFIDLVSFEARDSIYTKRIVNFLCRRLWRFQEYIESLMCGFTWVLFYQLEFTTISFCSISLNTPPFLQSYQRATNVKWEDRMPHLTHSLVFRSSRIPNIHSLWSQWFMSCGCQCWLAMIDGTYCYNPCRGGLSHVITNEIIQNAQPPQTLSWTVFVL
jgi:hypothetical protein